MQTNRTPLSLNLWWSLQWTAVYKSCVLWIKWKTKIRYFSLSIEQFRHKSPELKGEPVCQHIQCVRHLSKGIILTDLTSGSTQTLNLIPVYFLIIWKIQNKIQFNTCKQHICINLMIPNQLLAETLPYITGRTKGWQISQVLWQVFAKFSINATFEFCSRNFFFHIGHFLFPLSSL